MAKKKERVAPEVPAGTVIAYVDGSYEHTLGRYGYGCVLFTPDGKRTELYGGGDNPETAKIRNVGGEMLGAMNAVRWAMRNRYSAVEIRYDYQGIEMWAVKKWKRNNDLTRAYSDTMQKWMRYISISFQKIKGHSGDDWNDRADELAKAGVAAKDNELHEACGKAGDNELCETVSGAEDNELHETRGEAED